MAFCLNLLFIGTHISPAQMPPAAAADEFRQASEALRNGNLDVAAAGFAAIVKQAPSFAEGHFEAISRVVVPTFTALIES